MKKTILTGTILLTLGAITACEENGTPVQPTPKTTVTATATATATIQTTPETEETEEAPAKASLPDLTGESHQTAQDTAQSLGFFSLVEEDATGQGRVLVWDRNWMVCDQSPEPGSYSTDTTVTLYSVKTDEPCP